jgi:hypothetical protein
VLVIVLTQSFTLVVLLGALIAVPYAIYAGRSRNPRIPFAIGLVVAALIYVVFAGAGGASNSLWLEFGGVALFGAIAIVGVLWFPVALAVGWALHIAWDLLLHPIHISGYAPWWYPVLCIGFDLFVAGFIVATVLESRSAGGPAGD